jgi:hypothetical protein
MKFSLLDIIGDFPPESSLQDAFNQKRVVSLPNVDPIFGTARVLFVFDI